MMLPVVLRDEADADLVSAANWYEQQSHGLGAVFAEAVQATLDRIAQSPDTLPIELRDIRMLGVKRFPYSVYYRIEVRRVLVLAITHSKRNPRVWKSRI